MAIISNDHRDRRDGRWRLTLALALVLAGASLAACRSKIEGNVRGKPAAAPAPEPPAPEPPPTTQEPSGPTEVDGLGETRLYYQSRSVISLDVAPDLIDDGSEFDLVNESNGQTLIPRQSLALTDDEAVESFALAKGYDIVLKLYPKDQSLAGKLVYGENKLRLRLLMGGEEERFSSKTIHLHDFDLLGSTALAFGDDVQIRGGYQGWLNATAPTKPAADGTKLTSGFLNFINE